MLKWFAPLLLLAAKPEVLIRLMVLVLAGAALFGGVWLLSNIALTFDALKNPYIAAAYAGVLFCLFLIVGMVSWLRLRRLGASPKVIAAKPEPEVPLPREIVAKRAKELSAKWEAESRNAAPAPLARIGQSTAAASPRLTRANASARMTLSVTGPAYTGKTALISLLVASTRAQPAETSEIVRLVDAGSIDGDERSVAALVEAATATDGVLFVVDQDLRAPEVAAIARFVASGRPLYLVVNKADQFNAADRDAILLSIRAKMPVGFAAADVVSVTGEPSPVQREIEDARGAVRIETRRPSPDIAALTQLLRRVIRPRPGRALQFETA
jgi:hypothetical protein